MKKAGRPQLEEPKTKRITIRFTEKEYSKLEQKAKEKNKSITELVRESLENNYLSK